MKATPLRQVTEKFGGKDKLLDAVVAAIVAVGGGEESKDDLRKRLRGVSNRKLVHIEAILSQVQARFGVATSWSTRSRASRQNQGR